MKVRFKNPPINELVIATYFNPPLFSLRSEHIGLFWSRIRNEFPTVEQQGPLGGAEALSQIGGEVFPMPRYWFVAEDSVNLIQLQKTAFMLNWRRRDGEYPHFAENLKPAFDKYFGMFEEFVRRDVGAEQLEIDQCELTYVNTIQPCDYWRGPQDTKNVVPAFEVPRTNLKPEAEAAFNCSFVYSLSADMQLRVSIRNGETNTEPKSPVLLIEIKAMGRLGQVGKPTADAWFERAHEAIVATFVDMTSSDIQHTYWERAGEDT